MLYKETQKNHLSQSPLALPPWHEPPRVTLDNKGRPSGDAQDRANFLVLIMGTFPCSTVSTQRGTLSFEFKLLA